MAALTHTVAFINNGDSQETCQRDNAIDAYFLKHFASAVFGMLWTGKEITSPKVK